MNTALLPADTFVVINKTILTDYDKKLIFNLYQPIVGTIAVNLYLSLWAYLDKEEIFSLEWSHHHLMTNTQLGLDSIISAREKLEGIGLMKTYYKRDTVNNYIYELYAPLNAYEFFNNPILNTALLSNIGKLEFEKIVNYYKLPDFNLTEYQNITCAFNDVYDSINNPNLQYYSNIKTNSKIKITVPDKINLNEMLSLIPEELVNIKLITKEIKDTILKLAYIYNFNNEQMQEIIINSTDETKKINVKTLKSNCEKYYKFENMGTLPTIIYKKQPEYLRKTVSDTSKKSKLVYQFETISPYEYLTSKNGGVRPSIADLNIASYLLVDLNMMPGVVNVLLDYVLKINDNKLNRNFVETIASQWLKSNIKTVEDAMNIAGKEYKKRQKVKEIKIKPKKEVKKPDWFDKDINALEATYEEQEEMQKMLSEFK